MTPEEARAKSEKEWWITAAMVAIFAVILLAVVITDCMVGPLP
jgi:hypothetical protein